MSYLKRYFRSQNQSEKLSNKVWANVNRKWKLWLNVRLFNEENQQLIYECLFVVSWQNDLFVGGRLTGVARSSHRLFMKGSVNNVTGVFIWNFECLYFYFLGIYNFVKWVKWTLKNICLVRFGIRCFVTHIFRPLSDFLFVSIVIMLEWKSTCCRS